MSIVSKLAWAAGLSLALAFTFSCSKKDGEAKKDSEASALVGLWFYEYGLMSFEFSKDGTAVSQANDGKEVKSTTFSWKLVDKLLVMTEAGKDSLDTLVYEISDKKLMLSNDKIGKLKFVKPQEKKIEGEAFTDSRDGKKYKTVVIGERTWMAENLNYEAKGSKCYKNDFSNCDKYGRLYNWNTANEACPSGWHLPNREEWAIGGYVGSIYTGKKLKSMSGWDKDGNGTDDYGFSALPGGLGGATGRFDGVGEFGSWWSATEGKTNNAYFVAMDDGGGVGMDDVHKSALLSIRCVQDYR